MDDSEPVSARTLGIMQGASIPPESQVTLANWESPPFNRWSFQHVPELIPCARLSRGSNPVSEFGRRHENLMDITYDNPSGAAKSIGEMLKDTYTDGFLVLHNGAIVSENYFNDMAADSLHLLMSCTKSYVGSLAGVFVADGSLDVEKSVAHYLPAFKETAFADATVREVLDMRTGVKFSEDYEDPRSDANLGAVAIGWWPASEDYNGPIGQTNFARALVEKEFPHGQQFFYRTVHTTVLALVIEAVAGERLQTLLAEVFWKALGCEWDGAITVDTFGSATAEGGLNATLRDWARFGQMMAQGGFFNGRQIIPEAWVADTRFGDTQARAAFEKSNDQKSRRFPNGMYRNKWWSVDADRGVYYAWGVYGQTLYVNPEANVVIAKFSSCPKADDELLLCSQLMGMEAIANALG